MGESHFWKGKHPSVPPANRYPGRASKVVLRQDVSLSLPDEKAPGEKEVRGKCEESYILNEGNIISKEGVHTKRSVRNF